MEIMFNSRNSLEKHAKCPKHCQKSLKINLQMGLEVLAFSGGNTFEEFQSKGASHACTG